MEQEFKFYQTFLDLNEQQEHKTSLFHLSEFRQFVVEKLGKNAQTVLQIAPYFAKIITKPQRLLYDADDYYISQDTVTNTYYICFRTLTMIDVDVDKFEALEKDSSKEDTEAFCQNYLEWLAEKCAADRELCFDVYKSRRGLHVFPLHTLFTTSEEKVAFQLEYQCDFYYTIYTHLLSGCSVRLNEKAKDSFPLYKFLCRIGHGVPLTVLENLSQFHYDLQFVFGQVGKSEMK